MHSGTAPAAAIAAEGGSDCAHRILKTAESACRYSWVHSSTLLLPCCSLRLGRAREGSRSHPLSPRRWAAVCTRAWRWSARAPSARLVFYLWCDRAAPCARWRRRTVPLCGAVMLCAAALRPLRPAAPTTPLPGSRSHRSRPRNSQESRRAPRAFDGGVLRWPPRRSCKSSQSRKCRSMSRWERAPSARCTSGRCAATARSPSWVRAPRPWRRAARA